MICDLNEIPAAGLDLDRRIELAEPASSGEGRLVPAGVHFIGRLDAEARGARLSGRFDAVARLECSRCLEPFDRPLAVDFALTLVRELPQDAPGEHRLDLAESTIFHAEGGRAELAEILREQIYLHLPLKPICSARCAGLCPTCGGNRNRIECGCRSGPVDSRLAPLMDLADGLEAGTKRTPVGDGRGERTGDGARDRIPQDGSDHGEPQA